MGICRIAEITAIRPFCVFDEYLMLVRRRSPRSLAPHGVPGADEPTEASCGGHQEK